ncbi:hypothetical protein G4X40_21725 [Rhodococcus sp. D2-41]|uniref:hypothetical protein n=1 Tax=Speluncibacter jeojiensis TaxID=2710754 RepID=UPI00240EA5B5|nr:hypothetical protein [Rhodococcus sp. D2-41]MDG3012763.1 hypothetical protein [Rhodococcus sp. D2-41]
MRVLSLKSLCARAVVFYVMWTALLVWPSHRSLGSAAVSGAVATALFITMMWFVERRSTGRAAQADGADQNG